MRVRADVARRTQDPDRRRIALSHIRDEALLVERRAGAPSSPKRARKRRDACETPKGCARWPMPRRTRIAAWRASPGSASTPSPNARQAQKAADALLEQLEALAGKPGPIVSAIVDIVKRWQALDLADDEARRARWEAAREVVQARFDRERDEQRTRAQFDRRLREWVDALQPPAGCRGFRAEARRARGVARHRAKPRRRDRARDAGRSRAAARRLGAGSRMRSPAPRRSSSRPRSSRPARRSTTRIFRSAGVRSIARCARPRSRSASRPR